ncbi:MAG: hypothetical protein Q8Q04_00905 [archaeon]|nr:hypothetical protein [archaeon]
MKKITRQALIVPEWGFKGASFPGAAIAVGSEKGLAGMVLDGLTNLPGAVLRTYNTSKTAYEANQDLDGMTARQYLEKYGSKIQEYANDVTEYLSQLGENITERPLETVGAAAITALTLYGIGEGIKFYRQKGQGGILTKLKRKLGNKIWPDADKK